VTDRRIDPFHKSDPVARFLSGVHPDSFGFVLFSHFPEQFIIRFTAPFQRSKDVFPRFLRYGNCGVRLGHGRYRGHSGHKQSYRCFLEPGTEPLSAGNLHPAACCMSLPMPAGYPDLYMGSVGNLNSPPFASAVPCLHGSQQFLPRIVSDRIHAVFRFQVFLR